MSDRPRLLSFAQAAEDCGCGVKLLRRAWKAGLLTVTRLGVGPKSDRIHPADLEAWIARSKLDVCQSPSVPRAAIRLRSATADERIAVRLGIGRTRTPVGSRPTYSPKPAPPRQASNPTEA
jgi:hypothetical protein